MADIAPHAGEVLAAHLGTPDTYRAIAYANWRLSPTAALVGIADRKLEFTPEQLVTMPLRAAYDALHALALLWSASKGATLQHALAPLLRLSTFSGCQVIWLLRQDLPTSFPDRFARFAQQTAQKALSAYGDTATTTDSATLKGSLTTRREELLAAITYVDSNFKRAPVPNDTSLWTEGFTYALPAGAHIKEEANRNWNLLSGDAHAQPWASDLRRRLNGATAQRANGPT